MRISAGRFKGREIVAPKGTDVRPTSDRVRQSLFNILEHSEFAVQVEGARIVDLFAGSGALGLEAMSRGAAFATFVETAAHARAALRDNINRFALGGATRILKRDATELGPCPRGDRFQLALLDPPYNKGLGERALGALVNGEWLADGALIVVEEHERAEFAWPSVMTLRDRRVYGVTAIQFATYTAQA